MQFSLKCNKVMDVTVVCHSYGGVPTSQALRGLEKPQSVGGERVSCIVYIAAFLLAEGVSLSAGLAAHIGSANDPFYKLLEDGNTLTKRDTNAAGRSYNDSSFEEGKYWVRRLQTHASSTFACPTNYVAWKDNPSWYLICKQDQAMAPEVQRALVKEGREYLDQAGGSGTGEQMFGSMEIDTCHSPFPSRPEVTAAFIESAVVAYRN
jgi:Alpha/beta hydrolase family